MTDDLSPLEAARRHVAAVAAHLDLDDATKDALHWAHETALRTDREGVVTYTDQRGTPMPPGADTAAWLRATERERPHLLGKAPPKPTASSVDLATATVTALMVSARTGAADASAELQRRVQESSGIPTNRPNFTELMISARSGDVSARKHLEGYVNKNVS